MVKDIKDKIFKAISRKPLEKIFDVDSIEDLDWIWVNREIFRDLCNNLKLDQEMGEEKIEEALKHTDDEEMIRWLSEAFQKRNYVLMNQFQFARLEKGYRPTKDIDTVIFVKHAYYRKLFIHLMRQYDWMLKAMAMDTYLKMGLDDKNLKEIYEEFYEGNSRIIEEIFEKGEYSYLKGTWKHISKTDELYFYKSKEFYGSWTEGEVLSKFEEQIRQT